MSWQGKQGIFVCFNSDLSCRQPLITIVTADSRVWSVVLIGIKIFHAGNVQNRLLLCTDKDKGKQVWAQIMHLK